MKCEKCGTELKWLYYPKHDTVFFMDKDRLVQTDFLYCRECNIIYRQWIESKVHYDKYEPKTLNTSSSLD